MKNIEKLHEQAKQGHASAQNELAAAYWTGGEVAEDKRVSVRWFRSAAEKGLVQAQFNLGYAYWRGIGIDEDKRAAVHWYRMAADQGFAWAQHNLGTAYWNGEGVAEDKTEAVRWWRKAAEQGFDLAQHNMGNVYGAGMGVAVDMRVAVRWWRKAAEQGHAQAQFNLGTAYWNGNGVVADKYESYVWYSIAKASGDEWAGKELRRTNWGNCLSQLEIRSAQKEAAQRMDAIESRKDESGKKFADGKTIGVAPAPKEIGIGAHVFASAWCSVVVVRNGDNQGSGVIVRPNIVATNCHVVAGHNNINVYKASNRHANTETAFPATIRQSDEGNDFCLLDVNGLRGVPVKVRQYDTLSVGEDVYALGAPYGLKLSLSAGVISQLRNADGSRLIQTDAAISPGSSGGGLFDGDSNLIGITHLKICDKSVEGIGFAIPADLVLGY